MLASVGLTRDMMVKLVGFKTNPAQTIEESDIEPPADWMVERIKSLPFDTDLTVDDFMRGHGRAKFTVAKNIRRAVCHGFISRNQLSNGAQGYEYVRVAAPQPPRQKQPGFDNLLALPVGARCSTRSLQELGHTHDVATRIIQLGRELGLIQQVGLTAKTKTTYRRNK